MNQVIRWYYKENIINEFAEHINVTEGPGNTGKVNNWLKEIQQFNIHRYDSPPGEDVIRQLGKQINASQFC